MERSNSEEIQGRNRPSTHTGIVRHRNPDRTDHCSKRESPENGQSVCFNILNGSGELLIES